MFRFSVVIICKNEEAIIGKTLQGLQGFTDVVVYDNGSADKTIEIARSFPATLIQGKWEGFGRTKNKANSFAKNDWILSLDADEIPDEELKKELQDLTVNNEKTVYEVRFKNFLADKWIRYGEWGFDKHIRLFNRKQVSWNDAEVHERLLFPKDVIIKQLKGHVLHYTMKNEEVYKNKMKNYASLNAEKYFREGKQVFGLKQWLSPVFSFLQNYIFKLGFLDGKAGLTCASMTARYTFWKYRKLKELSRQLTVGSQQSAVSSQQSGKSS